MGISIQVGAGSVAWILRNIAEYGDPAVVFVGGHSAGGCLALMIEMHPKYLTAEGVKLDSLAGLIPVSGQVMPHYTVWQERGIGKHTITADEAAPVFGIIRDWVGMGVK